MFIRYCKYIKIIFKGKQITSKDKYVIATQDKKLKKLLRTIPGNPIISFNRSVLALDAPSRDNKSELTNVLLIDLD